MKDDLDDIPTGYLFALCSSRNCSDRRRSGNCDHDHQNVLASLGAPFMHASGEHVGLSIGIQINAYRKVHGARGIGPNTPGILSTADYCG